MKDELKAKHKQRELTAKRLVKARERSGLSIAEASEKLNHKSIVMLEHWEAGLRAPPLEYLVKLSLLYQVSADYLLGLTRKYEIQTSQSDGERIKALSELFKEQLKEGILNALRAVQESRESMRQQNIDARSEGQIALFPAGKRAK